MQAQVTIHTSPPRSLCSSPLPGSQDPGTASPGERTERLRLGAMSRRPLPLQAPPTFVPLPPTGLSEPESQKSCSFNPILCEQGTDALRRPTCRGGSKSKAEPRELCEQRREREISPSSLRSSRLNLHNQRDVACICGIPE